MDARLLSGLEVLAAVVSAKSFVRAADTLGLTQSGVSRAIARLEERVGVRLVDRTARAVALTDEGRRFYAQVMPLYGGIEQAVNEASGAASIVRGRLRVNVDPSFARLVLAERLARFLRAHRELSLEVVVRDRIPDLVAEGFDVAVRFGEPEPSALVARRLLETRIITCAAPRYLAERGRPKHPRELGAAAHECILFRDPATGRPFPWEFHRGGRVLRVPVTGHLVINDNTVAQQLCVDGHGIAQLMELGAGELVRTNALVELFPQWGEERFPVYVLYPSRHLPPAKVRAFVDFVVASTRAAKLEA